MVETDWKQILSSSQRELNQNDREKLCESLAWVDVDETGINLDDLKTLFRLAQDLLKQKAEQVSGLQGDIEILKYGKVKKTHKTMHDDTSERSTDTNLETLAHQEEQIKDNQDILERLYTDIAELEKRKMNLIQESDRYTFDKNSESSQDTVEKLDEVGRLRIELDTKNKQIRRILSDIKVSDEEKKILIEKTTHMKQSLSEATKLIEKLSEQIHKSDKECVQLKVSISTIEKENDYLKMELDTMQSKFLEAKSNRDKTVKNVQTKLHHWKNLAKQKMIELEKLNEENVGKDISPGYIQDDNELKKLIEDQQTQMQQLQEKLSEASDEIIDSAKIIETLRVENLRLKKNLIEQSEQTAEGRNESDDGKERALITKWKKKTSALEVLLRNSEETLAAREKELTELRGYLKLLKSGEEGFAALIDGIRSKKRQLRAQEEGVKSLVHEVNELSVLVDRLQLENESMRKELGMGTDSKIETKGILAKFKQYEVVVTQAENRIIELENSMVNLELEMHKKDKVISKMKKRLSEVDCYENFASDSSFEEIPEGGGGDVSRSMKRKTSIDEKPNDTVSTEEMKTVVEENEGLRKGMLEILEFMKQYNSATIGCDLAIKCPSLEKVLTSLEARHSAGWYSPHMAAILDLRAAIGGRDALLAALNDARRETFDLVTKLSQESEKSELLKQQLQEAKTETKLKNDENVGKVDEPPLKIGFGSWFSKEDITNTDLYDKFHVDDIINKRNGFYEDKLKDGLKYFHMQFKRLYEKLSEIAIQAANDQNKWAILEEKYKAEIVNLQLELVNYKSKVENDSSASSGLLEIPESSVLQRKCSYLEDSYKYIRTLNENIKNEFLECERQKIIMSGKFENEIQLLILDIAHLTDKLKNSVSLDLFLKLNVELNDLNLKYRRVLDDVTTNYNARQLEAALQTKTKEVLGTEVIENKQPPKDQVDMPELLDNVENEVLKKQLKVACASLQDIQEKMAMLELKNKELLESQNSLINKTLELETREDYRSLKDQMEKISEENKALISRCVQAETNYEVAILQLNQLQSQRLENDLEMNLARHQILDLQATSDNKALIARLSGEVLASQLQWSTLAGKIERTNASLTRERKKRQQAEELLRARENIHMLYVNRAKAAIEYIYEIMQTLRQQYQGHIPTLSIEEYLKNTQAAAKQSNVANEKLAEIHDMKSVLVSKNEALDTIIATYATDCPINKQDCPHNIKLSMMQLVHERELQHFVKKIEIFEIEREELSRRCNKLEKTLVLVNQGFEKSPLDSVIDLRKDLAIKPKDKPMDASLEVEDMQSDDDSSSIGSKTITISNPIIMKPSKSGNEKIKDMTDDILPEFSQKVEILTHPMAITNAIVQTDAVSIIARSTHVQTEAQKDIEELQKEVMTLIAEKQCKEKEIKECFSIAGKRAEDVLRLDSENTVLKANVLELQKLMKEKELSILVLKNNEERLKAEVARQKSSPVDEGRDFVNMLKKLEIDRNKLVDDYKEILNTERDEYKKNVSDCYDKIYKLESQLASQVVEHKENIDNSENNTENKFCSKIFELEDQCFQMQSELDGCKAELVSCQHELERWKCLAMERLNRMEMMNSQVEERHAEEVEAYKLESERWCHQLRDSQKECAQLKLTLAEKTNTIDQLRANINALKSELLNMRDVISVSEPNLQLSAITEAEEGEDTRGSRTLEFNYLRGNTLLTDDTTHEWQDGVVERLRREKQLVVKQNTLLRRQVRALAGRERRAALDAQNLKSQLHRVRSGSSRVASPEVELTVLRSRVAQLQTQLASYKEAPLKSWDEKKRLQLNAERWQARCDEKCRELAKCEANLERAKAAIARLEKEKRILQMQVNDRAQKQITFKGLEDFRMPTLRDDDVEDEPVKISTRREDRSPAHIRTTSKIEGQLHGQVSAESLMARVEAQQRRIAALELASKGEGPLVNEYEKALAQIVSLKGQLLRLESSALESQLSKHVPHGPVKDLTAEVNHWKSYCEMLKEENLHLTAKLANMAAMDPSASSASRKIHELEQTVLTLRGLISKLQAEQKPNVKRLCSASPTPTQDKNVEFYKSEIAHLKRVMQEKDSIIERSKELLRQSAEREEELLRENIHLQESLEEVLRAKN